MGKVTENTSSKQHQDSSGGGKLASALQQMDGIISANQRKVSGIQECVSSPRIFYERILAFLPRKPTKVDLLRTLLGPVGSLGVAAVLLMTRWWWFRACNNPSPHENGSLPSATTADELKGSTSSYIIQNKELQEQLEAEQYFHKLQKKQCKDVRDELEEKTRLLQEQEEERKSLVHQLQIALARADSEALARSIAEETVADLEKEKSMKEFEMKDLIAKHKSELAHKESALLVMKDVEYDVNMKLSKKTVELDEQMQQNKKLQDELGQVKVDKGEIERLQAKLKQETLFKQSAVNKLEEVIYRKDFANTAKNKKVGSAAEMRKKEKENRRLKQELCQEREKYSQLLMKFNDSQINLNEEMVAKTKLQNGDSVQRHRD
uniref:non-specific serine/threonine protein kinase n=1 Tax=Lutzomyia longipalpis TaxID=7200 RepID=A0A1B0CR32_LUTLO